MSNYNKSFNFRNGVQVDNSNFIVNSNGAVGIGSTTPTQILDVNGNINVAGFITSAQLYAGVTSISQANIVNALVGVVTATRYYGDGSSLSNIPTSQWINIDVGLGYTSIYAQGNVGIVTSDPRFALQIGGNPLVTGESGIGINSTGNILVTGVVTAAQLVGSGPNITNINASNIISGIVTNGVLPIINNDRLPSSINVGLITAYIGFTGTLTGSLIGNVTGIVTGSLTGTASTAQSLSGTPNITVGVITSSAIYNSTTITSAIASVSSTLNVGVAGTALTVSSNFVGIGTTTATSDVQIRRNAPIVEVIGDSGQASISIGQSVGLGNSSTVLRFGNSKGAFDILNNSPGSFSQYLHAGGAGINTGRFSWIYGQTNNELMSLTYQGSLGIGITNPSSTLHVVGTSTVTSNSSVGGNLTVFGNLFVGGSASVSISGQNLYAPIGVSTANTLNVLNNVSIGGSVGIGTTLPITDLDARNKKGLISKLGISTASLAFSPTLMVVGSGVFDSVGIGTSSTTIYGLSLYNKNVGLYTGSVNIFNGTIILDANSTVGVGTTSTSRAAVDFSGAGSGININRYMIPPVVNTTQRNALSIVEGGLVYNSTSRRLELYNGLGWVGIATVP